MTILNANEYITKGDVMQILQKAYTDGRIQAKDGCASVLDDIAAIKADVQRGKWLSRCEGDIYEFSECSECGNTESCETPYCAQCGAIMDGEQE